MPRIILAFLLSTVGVFAADWPPLDSADLALQKGRVDPTADAECLLADTRISYDASYGGTTFEAFYRIKIFTDAGVRKLGTVDLPYSNQQKISGVAGRTIEPDGNVLELKKDAIFDHVVEKQHRQKTKAVSFAMPGVKPGAIIEYRYKLDENVLQTYLVLDAQIEIPVERVVYHIHPLPVQMTRALMQCRAFFTSFAPFTEERGGYHVTSIVNLPAFRPEPDAPPDRAIRAWLLVYYRTNAGEDPSHFWNLQGRGLYAALQDHIKVDEQTKQLATRITANLQLDREKLDAIYYYCQKQIKNVYGREVSDAERRSFKPNTTTADTLARGIGTNQDILLAFLALARAAGFDAHPAYMQDREFMLFRKENMLPFFNVTMAAVNVAGKWMFFEPGMRFLAPGQVRWQEQGIEALITDPSNPQFVVVPFADAKESQVHQKGQLNVDAEGTLEGEISETYSGQLAAEWRASNLEHSEDARKKAFEENIKARLPEAAISEVKVTDPADPSIPAVLSCHVRVEAFATRTGKRLFLNPAVFQLNRPPRFTATTRTNDILFHHPWSEVEDISIAFPAGFQLDHPDVVGPIDFSPVGKYVTQVIPVGDRILYHREFVFGQNGVVLFPTRVYPVMKKLFDTVHDNDAHMLTLKQEPAMADAK